MTTADAKKAIYETSLDEAKRTKEDIFKVIDAREAREMAPRTRKPGAWKVSLGDGRMRHGLNKRQADKLTARYNRFTKTDSAYVTK